MTRKSTDAQPPEQTSDEPAPDDGFRGPQEHTAGEAEAAEVHEPEAADAGEPEVADLPGAVPDDAGESEPAEGLESEPDDTLEPEAVDPQQPEPRGGQRLEEAVAQEPAEGTAASAAVREAAAPSLPRSRIMRTGAAVVLALVLVLVLVQTARPLPAPVLRLNAAHTTYTLAGHFTVPWPQEGQAAVRLPGTGTVGTYGNRNLCQPPASPR